MLHFQPCSLRMIPAPFPCRRALLLGHQSRIISNKAEIPITAA